ncbi:unnamed protein product, partial [Hapterophycus canaliculatus]
SLCIEKKQPYCHYQLKPFAKARATKQAATRRGHLSCSAQSDPYGSYGGGKRVVDVPEVTVQSSGSGVVTAAGVGSTAKVPSPMSLKRCRLSPSPATGLVGMQENGFLCHFFGCLGFLPLATERHVREAMVEILLGASTPDRAHLKPEVGKSIIGAPRGGSGLGGFATESEQGGWGGALAYPAAVGSPATCMMWCAIALGALVKGAPVENV